MLSCFVLAHRRFVPRRGWGPVGYGVAVLSKGAINRAGVVLRERARVQPALFGPEPPTDPEIREAMEVLTAFRRQWEAGPAAPLPTINAELSRLVVGIDAPVSNRLKRAHRIVHKLVHLPDMQLARMDDIGGCRVILPGLQDLRSIEQRLRDRFAAEVKPNSGHDYIANPKPTGYRAVHIILRCDGLAVEVQLRTALQHVWALAVEGYETRTGDMFKRGEGDPARLDRLRDLARFLADLDAGPPERVANFLAGIPQPRG